MKNLNEMLHGATMLSKSEMKNVKGGNSAFICSCHSVSGASDETITFAFETDSTMDLIERIGRECGDRGGTCNSI